MVKAKSETNGHDTSADTSAQSIVIQGLSFEAPAPYSEGHVLNSHEAAVLNQTFAENLRNNFASVVKEARKTLGLEDKAPLVDQEVLQTLGTKFAEYAAAYSFSGRTRTAKPVADPVEREAMRIARSIVTEHLAAHKIQVKSLPDGRMEALVTELLTKRPDIKAEAERRIHATKAAASTVLDDLVAKATAPAEEQVAAE